MQKENKKKTFLKEKREVSKRSPSVSTTFNIPEDMVLTLKSKHSFQMIESVILSELCNYSVKKLIFQLYASYVRRKRKQKCNIFYEDSMLYRNITFSTNISLNKIETYIKIYYPKHHSAYFFSLGFLESLQEEQWSSVFNLSTQYDLLFLYYTIRKDTIYESTDKTLAAFASTKVSDLITAQLTYGLIAIIKEKNKYIIEPKLPKTLVSTLLSTMYPIHFEYVEDLIIKLQEVYPTIVDYPGPINIEQLSEHFWSKFKQSESLIKSTMLSEFDKQILELKQQEAELIKNTK